MKINEEYTSRKTVLEMADFFEEEGFLQLNEFLENKYAKNIRKLLIEQNYIEENKPMSFKKKTLETKNLFELEIIKFIEYFRSKEFIEYIEQVTNFELNISEIKINLYERGSYTLLNDKNKREETLEVIFDLSDNFTDKMGGKLKYLTNEEEILYLSPSFNTLTITYKSEDVMKYLKYINNLAKENKILRVEISFNFIEEM